MSVALMERFCGGAGRLTMPERLEFLTGSPAGLECFAEAPGNFAGRPEAHGRVFGGPERCPAEGRDVLQRGVLRAVATVNASLQNTGVDPGAGRAAHGHLSPG